MIRGPMLPPPEIVELDTPATERARNRELADRHGRNVAWFNAHSADIYRTHRGQHICVAGQELFVGTDPAEVYATAVARHPDERGATFRWYIPTRTGPKIYATLRALGSA